MDLTRGNCQYGGEGLQGKARDREVVLRVIRSWKTKAGERKKAPAVGFSRWFHKQERLEAAAHREGEGVRIGVICARAHRAGPGHPWPARSALGCPVTFPKASATPAVSVPGCVSPVSLTELRATLFPQTSQVLMAQTAP